MKNWCSCISGLPELSEIFRSLLYGGLYCWEEILCDLTPHTIPSRNWQTIELFSINSSNTLVRGLVAIENCNLLVIPYDLSSLNLLIWALMTYTYVYSASWRLVTFIPITCLLPTCNVYRTVTSPPQFLPLLILPVTRWSPVAQYFAGNLLSN